MQSGRIYFLVNSKSKVNLLNKDLILLFGSAPEFVRKIKQFYLQFILEEDGLVVVKTSDAILKFYFGSDDIIEKFVIAEVLFCDEPIEEISPMCRKNNWLLFDLEEQEYKDLK